MLGARVIEGVEGFGEVVIEGSLLGVLEVAAIDLAKVVEVFVIEVAVEEIVDAIPGTGGQWRAGDPELSCASDPAHSHGKLLRSASPEAVLAPGGVRVRRHRLAGYVVANRHDTLRVPPRRRR